MPEPTQTYTPEDFQRESASEIAGLKRDCQQCPHCHVGDVGTCYRCAQRRSLIRLLTAAQAISHREARLIVNLAECYRQSGADPDGNEDWRLAYGAVAAVRDLRETSDKENTELTRALVAKTQELAEVDVFWRECARGWDMEDRAYFEREATRCGFGSPVAMAMHHIWKRHPKVEAAEQQLAALRAAGASTVTSSSPHYYVTLYYRTLEQAQAAHNTIAPVGAVPHTSLTTAGTELEGSAGKLQAGPVSATPAEPSPPLPTGEARLGDGPGPAPVNELSIRRCETWRDEGHRCIRDWAHTGDHLYDCARMSASPGPALTPQAEKKEPT